MSKIRRPDDDVAQNPNDCWLEGAVYLYSNTSFGNPLSKTRTIFVFDVVRPNIISPGHPTTGVRFRRKLDTNTTKDGFRGGGARGAWVPGKTTLGAVNFVMFV